MKQADHEPEPVVRPSLGLRRLPVRVVQEVDVGSQAYGPARRSWQSGGDLLLELLRRRAVASMASHRAGACGRSSVIRSWEGRVHFCRGNGSFARLLANRRRACCWWRTSTPHRCGGDGSPIRRIQSAISGGVSGWRPPTKDITLTGARGPPGPGRAVSSTPQEAYRQLRSIAGAMTRGWRLYDTHYVQRYHGNPNFRADHFIADRPTAHAASATTYDDAGAGGARPLVHRVNRARGYLHRGDVRVDGRLSHQTETLRYTSAARVLPSSGRLSPGCLIGPGPPVSSGLTGLAGQGDWTRAASGVCATCAGGRDRYSVVWK
ncbi:hypothetical protein GA0115254_10722 [Streptomyces sp. Ncost-T10-10d]|nr:hypothetical protein GA0115254_10722 [Streptomyces sp. Ncost-T10-10d]